MHVVSQPTIQEQELKEVRLKKIFFGHQSVGGNILEGIHSLLAGTTQPALRIVETADPSSFTEPLFAHAKIGTNGDPQSKCDAFLRLMETGVGERTDIAFMKFCYVDFSYASDVNMIFDHYVMSMESLKKKYPKMKLLHCTVPLRSVPAGSAVMVKKLLRRRWDDANIERNKFNRLLAAKYGNAVFDLAKLEAALVDGKEVSYTDKGITYIALNPCYTNDGGHLNTLGSSVIAGELLKFLSTIE